MERIFPINEAAHKKVVDSFLKNQEILGADACLFLNRAKEITEVYLIGGAIRNLHIGQPVRDLDLMFAKSIENNKNIKELFPINAQKNRMGGYKLDFAKIALDVWSVDVNWANTANVIKDKQIVTKVIAQGTFLNFDSLVYALNSRALNVSNFNSCILTNTLDIVGTGKEYLSSNPMGAAIVLRVMFLVRRYGFKCSKRLQNYVKTQIDLVRFSGDAVQFFLNLLGKYPKYKDVLSKFEIQEMLNNQFWLSKD